MSYQVLARKWRPKSFPELVGQTHVKSTLINALGLGRLHHAYLFTGTRGVGKTTIARIFAKSLNCELGITANPCGQCDICQSIEQGHFVDLIEIDAASRTKVEDTREILDNVLYAPTRGRFKVYLIDEVHMLSRHSFNALLKTLEEPPAHVKFLLATTEPQKLPVTILSRCLQFNLKALSRSEIVTHLEHILSAEQLGFDQQSLKLLAKAADGSLRDALSLTDQAIAQSNGALTGAIVQDMLGTLDKQWALKLLAHIVNNDAVKAMDTVAEIAQFMPDYYNLIDDLLGIFHLAAMTQLVPQAASLEENQRAFIDRLATKLSKQDVQLYYQLLLNGKKDLALAPDSRMGFEMALLRLLAFNPIAVNEQLPVADKAGADNGESQPLTAPDTSHLQQPKKNPLIEQKTTGVENSLEKSLELKPLQNSHGDDVETVEEKETKALLEGQQEAVLQIAGGMGFNPITAPMTAEPMTAEPQLEQQLEQQNVAEPSNYPDHPGDISFTADDETQDMSSIMGDYASMPMAEHNSVAPVEKPSVIKPVLSASEGGFEDPVAAILANRNLALDDMFQAGTEPVGASKKEFVAPSIKEPVQALIQPVAKIPARSVTPADDEPLFRPRTEATRKSAKQSTKENQVKPAPAVKTNQTTSAPDLFGDLQPAQASPTVAVSALIVPPKKQPFQTQTQLQSKVPAESPPEQALSPQAVNTSGIPRWSAEVDEWAALIEQMQLGGRERIVAVHSVWHKENKAITLTVANAQKHLASEGVHGQLTKALTRLLNLVVELDFIYTAEALQTPFAIQHDIDARRLVYAKQMIYQDPLVGGLQQQFSATLDDASITPMG